MKKHTQKLNSDGESALRTVTGMLETGLEGLKSYVEAMSAVVGESRDVEAAESFAHLLTKVAQVAAELRKAEAEERKRSAEITKGSALDWYRGLNQSERASFRAEQQQIDTKRSGLA